MADVRHTQPVSLLDQVANDKSKVFTDNRRSSAGRLRTGDVILKVNGVRLLGKSTAQALEILRAASGLVTLTVYRQQSEPNSDSSESRDQLNHGCRAGDSEIAPKNGGHDRTGLTSVPRACSSSHDSSGLSDSALLPPKSSPIDSKLQLVCPLPRPRLRKKNQAEPQQDATAARDLAGHCDFDVVTDGSVFGDSYNGTLRVDKTSCDDAAVVGAAHCRRHKSVGALTAAARSSDNGSTSTLGDNGLNGFTRHGSTAEVRSCFNSVMFADGFGDDDVGLTRWRDSVLTEESDDSEVPQRSRAQAMEAGEAKLIDAPSLEIECVSVKLHRGWHTKLGFSPPRLRSRRPGHAQRAGRQGRLPGEPGLEGWPDPHRRLPCTGERLRLHRLQRQGRRGLYQEVQWHASASLCQGAQVARRT
ncbi:hypothetical protein MTO96_019885 [Rhipicephalus appendiculatus]